MLSLPTNGEVIRGKTMFLFHIAFSVGLLAFGLGTCILIWGYRNAGKGTFAAKFIGWLMCLAAASSIICTIYFGVRYSLEGYFKTPGTHCPAMHQWMQGMDMDEALVESTPRRTYDIVHWD